MGLCFGLRYAIFKDSHGYDISNAAPRLRILYQRLSQYVGIAVAVHVHVVGEYQVVAF